MDQFQTPQNTSYETPPQPKANLLNQIPTVWNYVVIQLLMMIPIAGFVLLIIWAVGGNDVPLWKSNYARAYFIIMAIAAALAIVFSIFMVIIMLSLDSYY